MEEDYYEILAKKIDAGITGLSTRDNPGQIIEAWIDYLRELIPLEDVKYLVKLDQFPATMSAKRFAKKIDKPVDEAEGILKRLIDNDLVMRVGSKKPKYGISLTQFIHSGPPVRFFDMPKEKARKLAELGLKYLVDNKWYKTYSGGPETPLIRVVPVQESITVKPSILPYDDVAKIIDESSVIALQKCACKTRNEILGIRKCKGKYPLETCMLLNYAGALQIERGLAREISKEEAKSLLKEFGKLGLIHSIENYAGGGHILLCNCCACCCNPLGGLTQWDNPRGIASANYIAVIEHPENCTQCGTCVEMCPLTAISMGDNMPVINRDRCLGCGVCVVNCPSETIVLKKEEKEPVFDNIYGLIEKVSQENRDLLRES